MTPRNSMNMAIDNGFDGELKIKTRASRPRYFLGSRKRFAAKTKNINILGIKMIAKFSTRQPKKVNRKKR
ncbi:hypothetical protein K3495_g4069 [Podosphaera aphanis]|nr:hypothetical protein K3495_g4069 [Podosphaera aphanis]